jgi:hypothetical protein
MNPDRHHIDALLDGEPVDRDVLRSTLEDSASRDYLIDALVLRQLALQMGPVHYEAPGAPRSPFARAVRWMAATVILAAGAAGGYVYGLRSVPLTGETWVQSPPATEHDQAPAPTQTIRFEPGINWTNTSESN